AQAMKDLGLIDSKGNVREVSAKVGGRELRGQALKDWAKDAAVPDTAQATVDGKAVSKGDINKMVQIADATEELKKTYFTEHKVTSQQVDDLQSIVDQIKNGGIQVKPAAADVADAQARDLVVTTSNSVVLAAGASGAATFTLSATPTKAVSFEYQFIDGAATWGRDYTSADGKTGTITFPAGATGAALTQQIAVTALSNTTPSAVGGDNRWQGKRGFVLQLSSLDGARFDSATLGRTSTTVLGAVTGGNVDYQTMANAEFGGRLNVGDSGGTLTAYHGSIMLAPGQALPGISSMDLYHTDNSSALYDGEDSIDDAVSFTAEEISGTNPVAGQPMYPALDWSSATNMLRSYTAGVAPGMHVEQGANSGDNTTWEWYRVGLGYQFHFDSAAIASLQALEAEIGDITGIAFSPHLKRGGSYSSCPPLGLIVRLTDQNGNELYNGTGPEDLPSAILSLTSTVGSQFKAGSGNWTLQLFPVTSQLCVGNYGVITDDSAISMKVVDGQRAALTSVTAAPGTYVGGPNSAQTGAIVPLVVHFSEPVTNPSIVVRDGSAGGRGISPLESNTTATTFTFNYAVPNNPPSAISIQSWSAAELFGDEAGGTFDGATMSVGPSNGVNLVRGPVANAVTSVTTDKTQYGPAAETATVTVKIDATRPEFEDFAQELGAHDSVAQSLAYSVDGGATRRPLTYDEDASTDSVAVLTGTFDVPAVVSAQQKRVELYYTTAADPGASSARWVLAMGDDTYADFTIAAAIFFTEPSDLGIAEPAAGWDAEKRIVYAGGDQVPVVFGKNIVLTTATFQSDDDFAWSVETDGATDPPGVALATIDETGALRATGLGEGAIRVALTATNGGLADPVTVTTDPISVKVSSTPYISPPGTKGTVIGTQNQQLRLAWSSNATLLASKAETPYQAEYDVSVFPGDHTVDQMTAGGAGQAVWTDQTPDLAVTVPADTLSAISRSGVPAYSYLIATKNPDNPSRTLASGGGIVILAPAAAVDVSTDAGTRYLLDNHDPVHITWTMQHFDVANAADFTFSVSTPHGTVEGSDVKFVPGAGGADGTFQNPDGQEVGWATATGGTYTLDPVKLTSDDLDTVYTVEIKAKNASDSTYSYASTQLWVYDHTALDILVNGARPAGGKTVLSNRGWVQDAETRGQTALQDTVLSAYDNDQLSLKATISANYGEHAWKTVADQLGWASSDTSVATVNARRGAMYAPTSKDATYSPNTEFMLSGFGSGQTTITATHARTGMATSIDLSVDTLAGQLFLFQAYPRGTATMAYTDQKGASHSVTSDASGRFAIYSPDGVKGLVGFSETQGTGADAIEYRGTLHAEDLKSGEKDSAQMYTYPVNSIQLRSVAKLTLHFQKPDGQPYTGRVNLNGGVYTAGAYQPDSQLAPQGQDNLLMPDQYGAVTLTWDITRWGDVAHTATFDYAFEASFPGDDYLPMLVEASTTKSDAWEVDAASHVTVLRSAAGHKAGVPVTDSTTVTDQADGTQTEPVTDGRVGPTLDYPTIYLTSTFLWPGTSLTDAPKLSAQLFDQGTGQAPAGQSSKDITFPFSSMPVLRQTEQLDASTLWMDKLKVRPVSFSLFNGETAVATVAAPCGIVNGLEASVDGAGAAKDTAPEVTPNSASGQSPSNLDGAGIGNKFLGAAMGLVSNISVNTDAFKMMISPTDDPAVYKYVVQINVGTTPTDTGNTELDFDYAGRDTSNYRGIVTGVVPNPFDAYDMAKGRYSAKQQETLDAHKGKKTTHFGSALYKFDSFVEGKIYYDGTAGKWKSRLMGGFLQMGGGYEFTKAFNTMAGPVPVTFSLTAGAAVTFDLSWRTLEKQADPGGSGFNTAWLNPNQDSVMDMLTHFQAALYVDLFGGIGFDYEVVAFKIGVFGDLNINIHQYFLGRPYVAPKDVDAQGGSFKFTGTFGIRVDIKLFFFSLRFVIVQVGFSTPTASWGQWKNIGAYWKSITGQTLLENGVPVYSSAGARSLAKAKSTSELTADQIAAAKAYQQATGTSLGTDTVTVAQGSIENRDYLTQAKQVWASQTGGRHVRDAGSSGLTVYERNAYPNASPAIFNDGSGFLFLDDQGSSDITKTRVASYRSGQTSVIDDGGKGDSELTAAGGGSLAAAAWVRQTVDPSQDVAATGADQSASLANLAASAEVYAAVRQGDAWQTTALSANSVGDISPVVAVGGGKVLVAWQQVASSATDSAMTFDQLDRIVYRVYDVDSATWGPEIVAYNGTSGQVKGMAVALLPDGKTGSIVYTV
ncbi:MAG: hypothetical protein LBM66_04120, partial [Bifidobacteriaceae bacterium]|nr:hypothetical protein [Bifidobacteriaceae bacterium]